MKLKGRLDLPLNLCELFSSARELGGFSFLLGLCDIVDAALYPV
jgi:hypothetical protein